MIYDNKVSEGGARSESLYQLSAIELVVKLKTGQVTIHDCLDSLQQRIDQTEEAINALLTLCFDRAKARADEIQALPVERRGLLAGLPVTIKDLMPVANVRTTFGSRVYKNHIPKQSDRLVQRLELQGAVICTKSNTLEFCTGGIAFNYVFVITRSPHNTQYASGGAAASLAVGSA